MSWPSQPPLSHPFPTTFLPLSHSPSSSAETLVIHQPDAYQIIKITATIPVTMTTNATPTAIAITTAELPSGSATEE